MHDKEEFIKLFKDNIKREGSDKLLDSLINSDFFSAPASTRFHDAEQGGLCHHSIEVFLELRHDCGLMEKWSEETIAIVGLLHDVCKVGFYKVDYRNTKDENGKWIKVPYYTVDDQFPYGHGEKSVYLIEQFMKLTNEEAQAINAHMGGFDERKFVISNTFEKNELAVHLHMADLSATYLK